ncbi:hypothetical protein ACJX0J_009012, partial [Zea mays]
APTYKKRYGRSINEQHEKMLLTEIIYYLMSNTCPLVSNKEGKIAEWRVVNDKRQTWDQISEAQEKMYQIKGAEIFFSIQASLVFIFLKIKILLRNNIKIK